MNLYDKCTKNEAGGQSEKVGSAIDAQRNQVAGTTFPTGDGPNLAETLLAGRAF